MPNAACAGRAERPRHRVDDEQVDGGQAELRARREADLQHAAPQRELRPPVRRSKVEVRTPRAEVRRQPDDADHDGNQRRHRGAGDAERTVRDPAEDEDRRERHVDDGPWPSARPCPA
jgi:hypothetical protein